eukprot:360226-Chlamydomonas_euryale.AAC.2
MHAAALSKTKDSTHSASSVRRFAIVSCIGVGACTQVISTQQAAAAAAVVCQVAWQGRPCKAQLVRLQQFCCSRFEVIVRRGAWQGRPCKVQLVRLQQFCCSRIKVVVCQVAWQGQPWCCCLVDCQPAASMWRTAARPVSPPTGGAAALIAARERRGGVGGGVGGRKMARIRRLIPNSLDSSAGHLVSIPLRCLSRQADREAHAQAWLRRGRSARCTQARLAARPRHARNAPQPGRARRSSGSPRTSRSQVSRCGGYTHLHNARQQRVRYRVVGAAALCKQSSWSRGTLSGATRRWLGHA